MTDKNNPYLMENEEETRRLEIKTSPQDLFEQAAWCGIGPGQRILDLCCGPGKTTSLLYEVVKPGGAVVGVDASEERIAHARSQYGGCEGIGFAVRDIRRPLDGLGLFDGAWIRFVLEYCGRDSLKILRNVSTNIRSGGFLYLLDLDLNCLNHHELPPAMAELLPRIASCLEELYQFDAYAGRKLYSYLYDLGFQEIEVKVTAHHVIYGPVREVDSFNWMKKIEVVAPQMPGLFDGYPGGAEGFSRDFDAFFHNPRRFTYTPLIMCKGRKP